MRSAVIKDGVVVNIIQGSRPGSVECTDEVSIGWTYDGKEFSPPPPEPEPERTEDEILDELRSTRDVLLRKSDWTQLMDSPLSDNDRKRWAKYRQSLRDLPENANAKVVWPNPPEGRIE